MTRTTALIGPLTRLVVLDQISGSAYDPDRIAERAEVHAELLQVIADHEISPYDQTVVYGLTWGQANHLCRVLDTLRPARHDETLPVDLVS